MRRRFSSPALVLLLGLLILAWFAWDGPGIRVAEAAIGGRPGEGATPAPRGSSAPASPATSGAPTPGDFASPGASPEPSPSASPLPPVLGFTSRVVDHMPAAVSNPALVGVAGRVLCLGGNNEQGASAASWEWDPVTRRWQGLPPMRDARFGHAAARVGSRVLVFGGVQGERMVTRIEALDMGTRTWSSAGTLPFHRSRFGLAVLEDRVWIAGGSDEKGRVALLHVFNPATGRWERKADLPDARDRLALVALEGHLYALGGEGSDGRALASVYRYSPREDRWSPAPALQVARKNFAAARLGRTIVVAGGWDVIAGRRSFVPAVEVFDLSTFAWSTVTRMERPRDGCRALAAQGRMFCLAGYDGALLDSVEEMRWGVRTPRWRVDEELRFHLGWFSSHPAPPLAEVETPDPVGYSPNAEADITNINLRAIRGLGFPLPSATDEERRTFYLKFYAYPDGLDPALSARRILEPLQMLDASAGASLAEFLRSRSNVLVKKGAIELTSVGFNARHPFPCLAVPRGDVTEEGASLSPQEYFDRRVIFSSLYVRPLREVRGEGEEAARGSAGGVLAVHEELLALYERAYVPSLGPDLAHFHYYVDDSDAEGVGAPAHVRVLRVPRAPLVFEGYQDLPMPQDPKHLFLSGLLLVHRDDHDLAGSPAWQDVRNVKSLLSGAPRPSRSTVLEVGSVLRTVKP